MNSECSRTSIEGRDRPRSLYKGAVETFRISLTENVKGERSQAEKKMDYVVDIQGFQRVPNIFIFKEVAILTLQESDVPLVFNFQPPTDWTNLATEEKCTARWLERNYHGIPWGSGEIPYSRLNEVIRGTLFGARFIYIKGRQKKLWLSQMIPERM